MFSDAFSPSMRICSRALAGSSSKIRTSIDSTNAVSPVFLLQRFRKLDQRVNVALLERGGDLAGRCGNDLVLATHPLPFSRRDDHDPPLYYGSPLSSRAAKSVVRHRHLKSYEKTGTAVHA